MKTSDWREDILSRIRTLIEEVDPDVVEERKWPKRRNQASLSGRTTASFARAKPYKNAVKVTFAKGAFLKDPARLFNSSLEGKLRRAIDIREGGHIDASAFKALVRGAIALNSDHRSKSSRRAKS